MFCLILGISNYQNRVCLENHFTKNIEKKKDVICLLSIGMAASRGGETLRDSWFRVNWISRGRSHQIHEGCILLHSGSGQPKAADEPGRRHALEKHPNQRQTTYGPRFLPRLETKRFFLEKHYWLNQPRDEFCPRYYNSGHPTMKIANSFSCKTENFSVKILNSFFFLVSLEQSCFGPKVYYSLYIYTYKYMWWLFIL